jgi:hypothetical protein
VTMTIIIILISVCCFFSLSNLIFVVLLSNSIFRLLAKKTEYAPLPDQENKGLVDIKNFPTYDPRFLNKR